MNVNRKEKMNMELTTAPHARGSDTSKGAAHSIQHETARLRQIVLELVTQSGADGVTCDGAEERLALSHQTCSPRFWELHKRGAIVDSGRRRATRSGRKAVVYVLPKFVPQARANG